MIVFDILGIVSIALGLFFFLGSAIGLVRFPDFYTRMHAAGQGDTLSTLLIVGGFALCHMDEVIHALGTKEWYRPMLLIVKMLGICVFIMVTSPTSTHALIDAGYEDGIEPEVDRDELKESRQAKEASE